MTAVTARCKCGWESEPVAIEPGATNGEWSARAEAAAPYRAHFDDRHRPRPEFITTEGASHD